MGLTVAKKAVIKRTEQAHRSRVRNPFPLPPLPAHIGAPSSNPAHIDTYRAPTHTSLHLNSIPEIQHNLLRVSFQLQDHKVFARHEKFGTFQVPKEFLNTNKQAPAAVALKLVWQAR